MNDPQKEARLVPFARGSAVPMVRRTLPRWVKALRAGPLWLQRAFLVVLDQTYLHLEVGLKLGGLVVPFDHVPEVTDGDSRYASWDYCPRPALAALRVPLPDNVQLRATIKSIFARGGVWETTDPLESVVAFCRDTLSSGWVPIEAKARARLMMRQLELGAELAVLQGSRGLTMITIRQTPPDAMDFRSRLWRLPQSDVPATGDGASRRH